MALPFTCLSAWAPRAACQTRSAPLLHLFDGYKKCLPLVSSPRWRTNANVTAFSTSPYLAVKCKGKSEVKSKSKEQRRAVQKAPAPPPLAKSQEKDAPTNDSRLQAAPTVASHTEGAIATAGEQLTWRDYDPEGGMPLPGGERGQGEINAIFGGEHVDTNTGNYILSVMHWRRLSGALIDAGLDFPKDSGVGREQALMGLEYVRQLVPDVDEAAEGSRYAEEEVTREQERIQARAVKLGIYKAAPGDAAEEVYEEEEEEVSKQGTEYGRERSGQSALQRMREEKEAAWEEQQAANALAAAEAERQAIATTRGPLELSGGVQPTANHLERTVGPNGVSIRPPRVKAWLQPVERKAWVKHYEDAAQIIKTQEVPNMSTAQRLVPSFLLLLLILSGCYYLHENYTPPPKSARMWPDTGPSAATLLALSGILIATFIMGRIPPLWRTYSKYMCIVPAYPYALSLFGSAFRHDTLMHLGSNLVSLWIFGLMLHEEVGRGTFLSIYFASGAFGGFASLAFNVYRKLWMSYIFGASGAVFGVVAAVCTIQPNGSVRLFGWEIPVAAWVFLALQVGGEIVAAKRGVVTNVDHVGHLGGAAAGFACAIWLRLMAKRDQEANLMVRQDGEEDIKAVEAMASHALGE